MVQLVEKVTDSKNTMGKDKKKNTAVAAVEAPSAPVIAKQTKKNQKNKKLATAAAQMAKSEENSAQAEALLEDQKLDVAEESDDAMTEKSPNNKRKQEVDDDESESKKARTEYAIFVGKLKLTSNKKSIRKAFSKLGNITDIHLPRRSNPRDKRNKGFGFVKFEDEESVQKAIAENGQIMVDEQIVIIKAAEEKVERPPEKNNLFVAKLSPETTKEQIESYFSQFGEVETVALPQTDGQHKGYAFVTFAEAAGSDAALAQADHEINEAPVVLKPPKNKRKLDKDVHLFVAKLSPETTMEHITEYFEQFGAVKDVSLPTAGVHNKGYAFVTFEEAASSAAALAQTDHAINSTEVILKPPRGQSKRESQSFPNEFFVGNVGAMTTKESLEEYFTKFGELENLTLPRGHLGNKGFCFVAFKETTAMTTALESEHEVDGSALTVRKKRENGKKFGKRPRVNKDGEEDGEDFENGEDDEAIEAENQEEDN